MKLKNKVIAQVAAISLLFVGIYFGMRFIPDSECAFLHYEPVEVTADGLELCEPAPTPFIDVTRLRFPVSFTLLGKEWLDNGQVKLRFDLRGPSGQLILPHELALTHSERIHLMLVAPGLTHYHHLHPSPIGSSGQYVVSFRPGSHQYRFFAEFVPLRSRQLAVASGELNLGTAESLASLEENVPAVSVRLSGMEGSLPVNRDHPLRLVVEGPDGQPAGLEKTMGAYAHLVAFEETLSGFSHMHPLEVDLSDESAMSMNFLFHPTRRGNFRIWVQIRHDDQDWFLPFDTTVI